VGVRVRLSVRVRVRVRALNLKRCSSRTACGCVGDCRLGAAAHTGWLELRAV